MTVTETKSTYFIIRATATCNRDFGLNQVGDEIFVYVGFERGMTDSGRLCWSEYSPTHFSDPGEGLHLCKFLSTSMWGFKDVRDIKVIKVVKKVTTEITEEEISLDTL